MPVKKSKVPIKKTHGLTLDVYNTSGKVVGNTPLPKEIFGAQANPTLLSQAVRVYLANQRVGHASTKTRGEVKGSTRKIWRQKHTGRARHGAIRAPIFVGGGVAFGPRPRDYSLTLPKNMKRKALYTALAFKLKDKAIRIIDGLEEIPPKTKTMVGILSNVAKNDKKKNEAFYKRKILLILPKRTENIERASRNIKGITICPLNLLNTYEVINNDMLVFTKPALSRLVKTYESK